MEVGGIDTNPHPVPAKDYGRCLKKWGFTEIPATDYIPIKGDIRVFQNYPGGNRNGHIDMFNGGQWVSDYFEKTEWPGTGYKSIKLHFQFFAGKQNF